MSHCGYIVNGQLNEVGAMEQSEDVARERERMKGQKGERGRNWLNGTQWEEIGQRKGEVQRR